MHGETVKLKMKVLDIEWFQLAQDVMCFTINGEINIHKCIDHLSKYRFPAVVSLVTAQRDLQ